MAETQEYYMLCKLNYNRDYEFTLLAKKTDSKHTPAKRKSHIKPKSNI